MALTTIQSQWDIGNTAFTAGTSVFGLIVAATQDDVQVAAVMAAEAIGSQMIVDTGSHSPWTIHAFAYPQIALIGHAVDALNEDKNFRLEKVKLHLGLSKGGISGQLQQSSAAVRTFLLISVLRLGLNACEIGDILYEMLAEIKGVDMLPVSPSQLRSFVESLEGHSLKMRKKGNNALNYASIMAENAALQVNTTSDIFEPLSPDIAASLLLAAFQALRNDEVEHLEATGAESAVWIVSVLCWLFPYAVRVVEWKGYELISSTTKPAKISLYLKQGVVGWELKFWYKASEVSSLISIPRSETYNKVMLPGFIPKEMMYAACYRYLVTPAFDKAELGFIGTLACSLLQLAVEFGQLQRQAEGSFTDEDRETKRPSVPFRDICSKPFLEALEMGLASFGWPGGWVNLTQARKIAEYIPENCRGLIFDKKWGEIAERIDKDVVDAGLETEKKERFKNKTLVRLAFSIAEILLSCATQENFVEFDMENLLEGEHFPLISWLIASEDKRCDAESYMTRAFVVFSGQKPRSGSQLILAASTRGQVLFSRGLLWESLDAPKTAREAFQLIHELGELRWRGTRQRQLYELKEYPDFSTDPKIGTYRLDEKNHNGMPLLKPLLNFKSKPLRFSMKQGDEPNSVHLRCSQPSTGDNLTQLLPSLINWSCALRVRPVGIDIKNLQQKCIDQQLLELVLKDSAFDSIHSDPSWPDTCRAIASYSGDGWSDLLRFGTYDARYVECVVQDGASIFDCVQAANERFGTSKTGWIIMADH